MWTVFNTLRREKFLKLMGKTSAKFGLCACGNSTTRRCRREWVCDRCFDIESKHIDHGVTPVRMSKANLNEFRISLMRSF